MGAGAVEIGGAEPVEMLLGKSEDQRLEEVYKYIYIYKLRVN